MWLSGFLHRDLGLDGGPFDDTATPKLGWHTWEGRSWGGAETAFTKYPPHIGCLPPFDDIAPELVGKRQYVSLDRHAYSFAGSESDDEYIIQVEVAGFAKETHTWSDRVCEWLAVEIVAPLEEAVGIPRTAVRFHGGDEGIVPYISTAKSPIRMSPAAVRAFSGHLGHQHMPPPDTHWDPGRFPIERIFAAMEDDMGLTPDERTVLDNIAHAVVPVYEIADARYQVRTIITEQLNALVVPYLASLTAAVANAGAVNPADVEELADKVVDELVERLKD